MVGRLLGGVLNLAGGLLGGGHQYARSAPANQQDGDHSWAKHSWPGLKHSWPGAGGEAAKAQEAGNSGKVPPGQAKKGEDHTDAETKQTIDDNFTPQQAAPPPVNIDPGKSGEKGPPDVTGRKGPAGNDPKISQFDPTGKDAQYTNAAMNCGPTVGAMVARNAGYGKGMTDAQLIEDLGKVAGTTDQGTTGNGMIAMYEHMGLDTKAAKGADLAFMQSELQAGHHVNALGDYYEVPTHQDPAKTSGHYLDVTGMDKDGNFLVNDPADTTMKSMTAAEMSNFIGSAPNGGFVLSAWKPTGNAADVATPVLPPGTAVG
jgi:hypothetical protein